MRKKINWLVCFTALLLASSCNNTIIEDIDNSENELPNISSNENLTSQLRQIYYGNFELQVLGCSNMIKP